MDELLQALNEFFGPQADPPDGPDNPPEQRLGGATPEGRQGFLDQPVQSAKLDSRALERFRGQLREGRKQEYPPTLRPWEFLTRIGVSKNDLLTRTGALLFAEDPTIACPTAIVQCVQYHGNDLSASRSEPATFNGTIYDQITATFDFVSDRVRLGEAPSPHQPQAAPFYEFPMVAFREILANALVHRDYTSDDSNVHVRLFEDRIEVTSPGNWHGRTLDDGMPYDLAQLKGQSRKRNFLLARILSWIKLIEGEGSGIPSALHACALEHSPPPVVVQDQGFVTVTLRKSANLEPEPRKGWADSTVTRQVSTRRPEALADLGDEFLQRVAEATRVRFPGAAIAPRPESGYLRVSRPLDGGSVVAWPVGVLDGPVTEAAIYDFVTQVHAQFAAADPSVPSELVYGGPTAPPHLAEVARRHGIRLRSFIEYQGLLDLRPLADAQRERLAADAIYPASLYVDQRFRMAGGGNTQTGLLTRAIDWLASDAARLIVVLGDFGRGKTSFLRQLTRRLPEELPGVLPVLVELRTLEKAPTLDELLAQHLVREGVEDISPAKLRYMIRSGRIALLFDGFDELELRVGYDNAADYLTTLLESVTGQAKIVLTSRSQHFRSTGQVRTALGERIETRTASRVVILEDFSDEQILSLLTNLYGGDVERARARFDLLGQVGNLRDLAHNPRMLAFMAALDVDQLHAAQRGEGLLTPAGLYREIIYFWLQGEAQRQQHSRGLPSFSMAERLAASTALALRLWASASATIALYEVSAEVAVTLSDLASRGYTEAQASHAIASGSLLVRSEDAAFTFIHQSIMEWLVANAAAADPESGIFTTRRMSALMTSFFVDLAGSESASRWAYSMLADPQAPEVAKQNALAIIGQVSPADLSGGRRQPERRDLSGLDLRSLDLTGANLQGAKLCGALLRGMRLDDVDLSDADMRDADLADVRMTGGTLRGSLLAGSRWDRAALLGVEGVPGPIVPPELRAAAIAGSDQTEIMLQSAVRPTSVAFSPDGVLLAIGGSNAVEIVDASNGRVLRVLQGHTDTVYATAFSPDGTQVATASADHTACTWDVTTGVRYATFTGHDSYVNAVVFSPDGTLLATASTDGTARTWDVTTGAQRTTLTGHDNVVNAVVFSPDGTLLATASTDGTARTWETSTGQLRATLKGHRGSVQAVVFSPDGTLLATASTDGTARTWDATTGAQRTTLTGHDNVVNAVVFSPDGTLLATASTDGTARTWDATTGALRVTFTGHDNAVNAIAFSPDGQLIATTSEDHTVRIWDTVTGTPRITLADRETAVHGIAFSSTGTVLATASADRTTRSWDISTGVMSAMLTGHRGTVNAVDFSPDDALLATASDDRTARIWDTTTGLLRATLTGHGGWVRHVAFSPDGTLLATASADRTARIWDVVTSAHRVTFTGHNGSVDSVAFSPDGMFIATGSYDGTARIWDVATGTLRITLSGNESFVLSVAFSPDGMFIATGSYDGTARIWDVATGALRVTLTGHNDSVQDVAFAPYGGILATASHDRTARIWDVATGALRVTLTGHSDSVNAVTLAADGALAATASSDGTARIWDTATGAHLVTLVPLSEGYATLLPDGTYKIGGNPQDSIWWAIKLCRFAPGELDPYVPSLQRLPSDAPVLPAIHHRDLAD